MKRIRGICGFLLMALASLASATGLAQEAQVSLRASKPVYVPGEPIALSFEVLWLGPEDTRVLVNSLTFPELEIDYLNRFPVAMTVLGSFEVRTEPSRHEQRVVAPTMVIESQVVSINDPEGVRFANGNIGYYALNRTGRYVIRAIFRNSPAWPLYDDQQEDTRSSAIVVEISEPSAENRD